MRHSYSERYQSNVSHVDEEEGRPRRLTRAETRARTREQLLDAAVSAGEIRPGTHPYELMRGIGNLCIGRDSDPRYDPRRLVELLLQGLREPR